MASPEGLAVAGTLEWLFPSNASESDRERQRPLGIPKPEAKNLTVAKKSNRPVKKCEKWVSYTEVNNSEQKFA